MKRDIFISYSRKNYNKVMEIKRQIDEATGTECWIDLNGIESGSEQFIKDIVGSIDKCKVFLFMLSKMSQKSKFALQELNYAKQNDKHVVLVNIDNCEMEGVFQFTYGLADIIYWNDQPQQDKLIRDLCTWIGSKKQKREKEGKRGKKQEIEASVFKPIEPIQYLSPIESLNDLEKRLAKLDNEVGVLFPRKDSDSRWGYTDKDGKTVITCNWKSAWGFSEGLARVKENYSGKWGFIDKAGMIVVPFEWDFVKDFHEGLANVMDSSHKWGYIDKTGKLVIKCIWSFTEDFYEGSAKVIDSSGKTYKINMTGKTIS